MPRLNVPLALPLALFLASALVGVAIAYAPMPAAWDFFLYAAGVALYVFIYAKRADEKFLAATIALLGALSAALTAAFVAFSLSPDFPPFIQPNSLAGILVLALPLNLALAVHWARQGARRQTIALGALIVVLLFGLVLTGSRGAWLALTSIGGVFAVGYFLRRMNARRMKLAAPALALAVCAMLLAATLALSASPEWFARVTGLLGASANDIPRLVLYAQVWRLIQDYIFTGSGLGTFPMVYSTYALQIHVYILPHAHNVWLQIWMEQGLLGLVALGWFLVGFYSWAWSRRTEWNWLALGGLAASTAMLLHGLVDAAFWYADVTRALLFAPFAFAVAGFHSPYPLRRDLKIGAALGATALLALILFWKPLAPRAYANLASLMQTRIELAPYEYPYVMVEYVRRDANLESVTALFEETLALDPANITAYQRLAQIELARGNYAGALALAQAAYTHDAGNPITWQLLGDAHLALGHDELAYAYWSRVADAESKLNVEAAIRYQRQGDEVRAERARAMADRIGEKK